MPKPKKGESQEDYMSRCVAEVKGEGKPQKQAVAQCLNMWRERSAAGSLEHSRPVLEPIRSVADTPGRYRAYAVRFNGPDDKDLYDTYFTSETGYMLGLYREFPWLYDHGQHERVGPDPVGTWDTYGADDTGVFVEGELDEHHRYREAITTLIDEGVLYPSSGALSHLVRIADDGFVQRWPIAEVSSTVRPGDWRMEDAISEAGRSAIRSLYGDDNRGGGKMSGMLQDLRTFLDDLTTRYGPTPDPEPTEPADTEGDVEEPCTTCGGQDARAIVLEELAEPVGQFRTVLTAIDTAVHDHDERLAAIEGVLGQLAETETERVRSAVQNPTWLDDLHIPSRGNEPVDTDEAGQVRAAVDGVPQDATPWERVTGQRVG